MPAAARSDAANHEEEGYFKKIDIFSHVLPKRYLEAIRRQADTGASRWCGVLLKLACIANVDMSEIRDRWLDEFPAFVASLPMNNVPAALEETDRVASSSLPVW